MKRGNGVIMMDAVSMLLRERLNQDEKWGKQRHSMEKWLSILVEEVGEFAQAIQKDEIQSKKTDANNKLEEIIQVSAVAVAIAEQLIEEERKQYELSDL